MSLWIYRLLTGPAWLLLLLVGLFHRRVRENLSVRRGWAERLEAGLNTLPVKGRVWIHCASMGEFEAVRPLARLLREQGRPVVISFFSTSGPRHLDHVAEADLICYLPFDTPWAARRFALLLKPALAVVSKHDLWPNLLLAAQARGAKLAFINANFHSKSRLAMTWLRPFHRALLRRFDLICTVSDGMAARFRELLGPDRKITVPGDSRFDRVVERALEAGKHSPLPAAFLADARILVAGSSWRQDEQLLLEALVRLREDRPELRLLLVPHEPTEAALSGLERELATRELDCLRLSELQTGSAWAGQAALIVDRVGLLAGLYSGCWLAWVGGGFTTGVHSVIEPAAHGLPVCFGPIHHVSQEAQDLLACGGAREFATADGLVTLLRELARDEAQYGAMASAAHGLVEERAGAARRILDLLLKLEAPPSA